MTAPISRPWPLTLTVRDYPVHRDRGRLLGLRDFRPLLIDNTLLLPRPCRYCEFESSYAIVARVDWLSAELGLISVTLEVAGSPRARHSLTYVVRESGRWTLHSRAHQPTRQRARELLASRDGGAGDDHA